MVRGGMGRVYRTHDYHQSKQKMTLRFAAWIVILICCFVPLGWAQQTADVAYFEMVRVKPGDNKKFETTMKRHWAWHEKRGETWNYFVWTVDTGKNDGAYQIVSFGHTWKEVDESNAQVAGTPGPEEDPAGHGVPVCRSQLSWHIRAPHAR
jgi:hypothetical protein